MSALAIIAVGGGAISAMNSMIENYEDNSEWGELKYVAVDTDPQSLSSSLAPTRLHIGRNLLRLHGFSTQGNPVLGQQAAEENRLEIAQALNGADFIIVLAMLGGGTGSGAAPIVAAQAQQIAYGTLGLVTMPYKAQGREQETIAEKAVNSMSEHLGSILKIYCDRSIPLNENTPFSQSFAACEQIIGRVLEAFCGFCLKTGVINIVWPEINSLLRNDGASAMFGFGTAVGQNRVEVALHNAINSPMLFAPLTRAKKIMLSITGVEDLELSEVEIIAETVCAACPADAEILFNYIPEGGKNEKLIVAIFGFDLTT